MNREHPQVGDGETRFQITEIRVKLTEDPRNKLKAYCSVTIDNAFVVRDLKIIDGSKGPFVAMPSRKLADHCTRCHHKNHLRASYCNQCGGRLDPERAPRDERGRSQLHADLAHPINSQTRIEVHKAVVRAYSEEADAAQRAGAHYQPKTFDDFDALSDMIDDDYVEELERRQQERERKRGEGRQSEVGGSQVGGSQVGGSQTRAAPSRALQSRLKVVIVGPGRVGSAFGRQLATRGVSLCGFVGRDPVRAAAAVQWSGAGRVLGAADHVTAHIVIFAVGDRELTTTVAALLAAAPPRSCSLWLHTSGCHGLSVFDAAAAAGARRGSLHPVAPFADAAAGLATMAGRPAVLAGDPASLRLLHRLAELLGMVPVVDQGGDRALYHAACSLAANGLVALRGLVDDVFAAAAGLSPDDARRVADALMTAAIATASATGAKAALSGPVLRGDAATVSEHLRSLGAKAAHATPAYRELMLAALRLAVGRGLPAAAASAVQRALEDGDTRRSMR